MHAVAVELDFVEPVVASGAASTSCVSCGGIHSGRAAAALRRPATRYIQDFHLEGDREFADSPLEETGFEPLVPGGTTKASRGLMSRLPEAVPRSRSSSEVLGIWQRGSLRRR